MFFESGDFNYLLFQRLRPRDKLSFSYINKSTHCSEHKIFHDAKFYVNNMHLFRCENIALKIKRTVKNPILVVLGSGILTYRNILLLRRDKIFHEIIIYIQSDYRYRVLMKGLLRRNNINLANRIVIDLSHCKHLVNIRSNVAFKLKRVVYKFEPDTFNYKFNPQALFHSLHVINLSSQPHFPDCICRCTLLLSQLIHNPKPQHCEYDIVMDQCDMSELIKQKIIPKIVIINRHFIYKYMDTLIEFRKKVDDIISFVSHANWITCVHLHVFYSYSLGPIVLNSHVYDLAHKLEYLVFSDNCDVVTTHDSNVNLIELLQTYPHIKIKFDQFSVGNDFEVHDIISPDRQK